MNDAIAAIALGRRIDLTREADFIVGGVQIRPTACEVFAGGRRIRLQPRVMQVLVALARAGGQPVSREALVQVCWGQVTVGEDALNRCIQRLRRLADTETKGAFAIETIPRLGYRLTLGPAAAQATGVAVSTIGRRRPRLIIAAGLIAVTALAIAAALIWSARPARWTIERSERLVSTPLLEGRPAISPDGTMLAYSAGSDNISRHIYLKRLSGGESIQLTDDPYDDDAPAWSPDGARIAYAAYRQGEPCRIMIAPVPAGLAREVGRCRTEDRSKAVWNQAGDALLFVDAVSPTASQQIMSLDLATGLRRPVSHPPGGFDDVEPAVSPDGRWLLFSRTSTLPDRVMIQDLKTGRERVVAQPPQEDNGDAWAEDSRSIFFVGETAQGWGIWSYPIDRGPRDALISIGLPLQLGRLATARGGLLAAEIISGRHNVVSPPSPKDTAPVVVDPANDEVWSPAFAPDGTLVTASTRSGGAGIWLMRPGGRARMLLSIDDGIPFGMAWSPDAANLAFVTLGIRVSVDIVSVEGERRTRIPAPGTEVGDPVWSGDGRALVFPVRDRGGWRIWRADLARPKAPYPITGYGWVSVKREGDTLYGVRPDQPGVWRLGPTPRRITAAFSGPRRSLWTIFKDQIVYPDESDPRHPRLLSAPLSGGAPRPFADLPHQASDDTDFAIDPRSGTPVYIEAIGVDSDIELFHLARR